MKEIIKEALKLSEEEKHLDSLTGLRKAFFTAYEYEYNIYPFREHDEKQKGLLGFFGLGLLSGMKAHYWTRNKQWIQKHVKKPIDYIQINHEQLKTDCMEWGVSTVDIENFRRLTPETVRTENEAWHIDYTPNYAANELNSENFNFCLDILIDFLLKKQEFDLRKKFPKNDKETLTPPIYVGKPVFEMPSQDSSVLTEVQEEFYYSVDRIVSGFNSNERYLYIHLYPQKDGASYDEHVWGYLLIDGN
ncbi:hypothetical protein [Alteromonas macleodii]|uniref:hypothetical protein n=1 Tax=Alteromonas macleodii TaxID=28108 RepID=UPI003DA37A67